MLFNVKRNLCLLFIAILVFSSCKNGQEPLLNEEARILEFSILEIPEASFSLDHSNGIVKITNPESVDFSQEKNSLTAVFTASEGAKVYVNESKQVSGETSNSYSKGLNLTVVSEDKMNESSYFVYIEPSFPSYFYLNNEANITHNPSGISPLTATLDFETRIPVSANIEILGDIPIEKSFTASDIHNLPILGLYPDSNNKIVLSITDGSYPVAIDTFSVQTDPIPSFFPEVEINVLNESAMEPGMHFNEFHVGNAGKFNTYPFIIDNNGDIRWYIDLSDKGRITWPVQFNNDLTFYAVYGVTLYEWDMLGNELKRLVVDYNDMHHEAIKLPNGNYVIAVSKQNTPFLDDENIERDSVEDYIIEIDGATGEILTEWDMAEILDVDRIDFEDPNTGDWFHMNAIWYDENDESLIVSGRNQGLVKVNWNNELKWILAPHKGWGNAGRYGNGPDTRPFLLTALDASGTAYNQDVQDGTSEINEFSWVWGQHAPMILPNGNLFVFDNGSNRNFGAALNYSMGTEYKIDEEEMTIQQVWSYGKNRGSSGFSKIISDVDFLSETGNRLIAPGFILGTPNYSKVFEVTYPEKEVVFESTLKFKNELADGQGWGNIDITYRAERVSLYR